MYSNEFCNIFVGKTVNYILKFSNLHKTAQRSDTHA